jgi:nicotinamide N-methyltransferase
MAHFLAKEPGARVLVIAGFHTGHEKVAHFFDIVGDVGLAVDIIFEMDTDGERREWNPHRQENAGDSKRWLVMAALKWRCL